MIKLNVCDGYLICDERRIPVMGEYDVVVAGGGMAGCGAALAAAKEMKWSYVNCAADEHNPRSIGSINDEIKNLITKFIF